MDLYPSARTASASRRVFAFNGRLLENPRASPILGPTGASPAKRPTPPQVRLDAYSQPADPQAAPGQALAQQGPGPEGLPAAPRRLHPGLYDDPEEAELRSA